MMSSGEKATRKRPGGELARRQEASFLVVIKMLAQRGEVEPQAAGTARLQHVLSLRRSSSGFVLRESVPQQEGLALDCLKNEITETR